MKINVQVTAVIRDHRGTTAEFSNEQQTDFGAPPPGQLGGFQLRWSNNKHVPIELGARYTLTLTPGASPQPELTGLKVEIINDTTCPKCNHERASDGRCHSSGCLCDCDNSDTARMPSDDAS